MPSVAPNMLTPVPLIEMCPTRKATSGACIGTPNIAFDSIGGSPPGGVWIMTAYAESSPRLCAPSGCANAVVASARREGRNRI